MPRLFLALLILGLSLGGRAESLEIRPLPLDQPLEIKSGDIVRRLENQGDSFRTTSFRNVRTGQSLAIDSDEFGLRLNDGRFLTARDYTTTGIGTINDRIVLQYQIKNPSEGLPALVILSFQILPTGVGKLIVVPNLATATVEIERFRTKGLATRGGRGEPVVLADSWILLPASPTTLTRHTDGNQPSAYSHRFEKVGNHSFVDFENGDVEPKPAPGLVRCFFFGLRTTTTSLSGQVLLTAKAAGRTAEETVIDLARTAPKTRSYTHYNNWFDPAGKNLKGDNLPAIHRQFLDALKGSGIKVDGLVPDNGWQDRKSVWQPAAGAFPAGMSDLSKLSATLRSQGSSLGLWMSADSTTNDIAWGVTQGFVKAQPNAYFKRYFAHYALADENYQAAFVKQLTQLVNETKVSYLKFDFNHLSNVIPTDRHGHEAEFNGFVKATAPAREKGVFINATNWTWHSPAWLNYADSVWLLAGDDGFNGNWPELSGRAQATTDRDVYFWRMWGDPADRPWFPISNIMTHGIIRNPRGQMSFKTDLPRDWADHVLMHYGRGTLLREWYLTPATVTGDEWKSLIAVHQWTESRKADMINTCFVGGRPDEGQAYGYVGWSRNGETGTLVARNPAAGGATLSVRLDSTTFFAGQPGQVWHARMIYPYRMELATTYRGGETAEISLPGYETVALEFSPGEARGPMFKLAADSRFELSGSVPKQQAAVKIADFISDRRELLVIGRPMLPDLLINGKIVKPTRSSKSAINQYPSYARDGMVSATATPWQMAGYDLKEQGNDFTVQVSPSESTTNAEVWLLTERPFGADDSKAQTPLTFPGALRHTTCLLPTTTYLAVPPPPSNLAPAAIKTARAAVLALEVFGNNGQSFGDKSLTLNGETIGILPTGGDTWTKVEFKLTPGQLAQLLKQNSARVTCPKSEDKFKIRGVRLTLTLADGTAAKSSPSGALTSHADWTFFEGQPFTQPTDSGEISLGL